MAATGISLKRRLRLQKEVAPLVCQGATIGEICEKLNISHRQAHLDMNLVLQLWHESQEDQADRWRPMFIQRYEFLYAEAVAAWLESRSSGKPNIRALDSAARILEVMAKLLGLQVDIHAVQNNLHLHATNETAAALAPLDAESYMEMLQAGGLGELNAVPPISRPAGALQA